MLARTTQTLLLAGLIGTGATAQAQIIRCSTNRDCSDGLECTADICDERLRICTWNVLDGNCVLTVRKQLTCVQRYAVNPENPCQTCRDDKGAEYQRTWFDASDLPCDDGLACTTYDTCSQGVCLGKRIDGNCIIDNTCYARGDRNPAQACESCRDDLDAPYSWTPLSRADCDDGDACTSGDTCVQGVCVGSPRCQDDRLWCTTDTCSADTGACRYSLQPQSCLIDGACYETGAANPASGCQVCRPAVSQVSWFDTCDDGLACTADLCLRAGCSHSLIEGYCVIDGRCVRDGEAQPDNPCLICAVALSTSRWSPAAGARCDDDGLDCTSDLCNGAGECVHSPNGVGCAIDGRCVTPGAEAPDNPCLICDPRVDVKGWSPRPDETYQQPCYDCAGGTPGVGQCAAGAQTCVGGRLSACEGAVCPSPELCDGVDNDCRDGADDPWPELGTGCGDDACGGEWVCKGPDSQALVCSSDGASCDDGNPCTSGGRCAAGRCASRLVAAAGVACEDGDPCTGPDTCDGEGGCVSERLTCQDGTACDPVTCCGDAEIDCSDDDLCTIDSCHLGASACARELRQRCQVPPADAGATADATRPDPWGGVDAGQVEPDAWRPVDAGTVEPDAWESVDAGTAEPDAWEPADAGAAEPDAWEPFDGGEAVDVVPVLDVVTPRIDAAAVAPDGAAPEDAIANEDSGDGYWDYDEALDDEGPGCSCRAGRGVHGSALAWALLALLVWARRRA